MLISQKQLKANRKNAARSTGPKTAEGKAAVRHNAVKHGLYSRSRIINSRRLKEDPGEYDLALKMLKKSFRPQGDYEHAFVQKIVDCLWRLRRARRAEEQIMVRHRRATRDIAELMEKSIALENDAGPPAVPSLFKLVQSLIAPEYRMYVVYQKNRIHRHLLRAYSLLCQSQACRKTSQIDKKGD